MSSPEFGASPPRCRAPSPPPRSGRCARRHLFRTRSAELDRLSAAEAADREARQRADEARAAAEALRRAKEDDRRQQAAPLLAELDALASELAELEREYEAVLWDFVRTSRAYHRRHVAITARVHNVRSRFAAIQPGRDSAGLLLAQAESLFGFVQRRWSRFNGAGATADRCAWSRALSAEDAGAHAEED